MEIGHRESTMPGERRQRRARLRAPRGHDAPERALSAEAFGFFEENVPTAHPWAQLGIMPGL